MLNLINELWFLKRDLVSNGFDQALYRLAEEMPMTIHEYPSGEACWTWRVPEKWTCHEAYLETLDGRRLIDHADQIQEGGAPPDYIWLLIGALLVVVILATIF